MQLIAKQAYANGGNGLPCCFQKEIHRIQVSKFLLAHRSLQELEYASHSMEQFLQVH